MAKEIVCNICGNKFDFFDKQEAFRIYRELGYGTIYDGGTLELDICCKCMEKIIEKCKIHPVISREE